MKTNERTRPRRMRAQMAIAFAYFAGIALIVGWSLPRGAAADRPVELAMRKPEAANAGVARMPGTPVPAPGKTRSKMNCAGCAVIESVQRIDTHHALMAGCDAGDFAGSRNRDLLVVDGTRDNFESLADTVASLTAGQRGTTKVAVTTRHRIVVRFRDGSKQVLDEATPRTLQVGDRIRVITSAALADG